MHGFFYVGVLNLKDGFPLVEFKDLTFRKPDLQINFIKALIDQGISFLDMEMAHEMNSLQLQLENSPYPFVFYFFKGRQTLLMVVSEKYNKTIFNLMEQIVMEFEHEIDLSSENDMQKEKIVELTIKNLAGNLSQFLIPSFLIPEINPNALFDSFSSFFAQNDDVSVIYDLIDGSWTLSDIFERVEIDQKLVNEIIFNLWVNDLIYFRFHYYDWDVFEGLQNNKNYLEDGNPNNVALINKYNSNKIIRVIQLCQDPISYKEILGQLDITRTKLNKYMSELIFLKIIEKKPMIPHFSHISEDIVPLLSMQGFSDEDFYIFKKLESNLDGKVCLDDVALEIQRDSIKIKKLLDKYNAAIKIID
ncbi:hypothetical protein NEF87_003633 [Candidatus Lokiarchaeum ossiferum]|uniref:Uncharacterized protein n=1 Tax=Candidatus Lokiarchaeum ossiferum TaxID=2951803 RepID=A0ABY6HV03_9ARCH|nr:hypothetical protein NEF87_003633 [Candidatus Lokiarchaeum sp. B-35]